MSAQLVSTEHDDVIQSGLFGGFASCVRSLPFAIDLERLLKVEIFNHRFHGLHGFEKRFFREIRVIRGHSFCFACRCLHTDDLDSTHSEGLIFPDIEAGNIFYKACTKLAGAEVAGMVVGAKAPCVVSSRGDSSLAKLNSIALAALASR